jgi:hypothetical protein
MSVEKQADTMPTKSTESFRTEAEVWYEMAVHDIQVEPFEIEGLHFMSAGSQVSVITCEQRRGEDGAALDHQTSRTE